jgi:hypothetical protein
VELFNMTTTVRPDVGSAKAAESDPGIDPA